MRGSEEALEGPAGFYNAFTGNNRGELSYVFTGPQQVSFNPVTEGLSSRWELLHTVLKIYPDGRLQLPDYRPDDRHPPRPQLEHRRD